MYSSLPAPLPLGCLLLVKIKAAKFTASVLGVRSLLFFSTKNVCKMYLKPWFYGFTHKVDKIETKIQNVSQVKLSYYIEEFTLNFHSSVNF